jgi:hypothetical protein
MKTYTLVFLAFIFTSSLSGTQRIIGGKEVDASDYPEIVKLTFPDMEESCTGIAIGEKVILTAAHCVPRKKETKVKINGKTLKGHVMKSKHFKKEEHDLAAVVLKKAKFRYPSSVLTEKLEVGDPIEMLGFGCQSPETPRPKILRRGLGNITEFQKLQFTGAGDALCSGDEGAPARLEHDGWVVGVGSVGNLKDLSYFTRLDTAESLKFFESVVKKHKVEICGFNVECE